MLASFGLDKPFFEPTAKRLEKTKQTKKRKASPLSEQSEIEEPEPEPAPKRLGTESGPRRSARQAGKAVDYSKERKDRLPRSAALTSGIKSYENEGPQGQGGMRRHNP